MLKSTHSTYTHIFQWLATAYTQFYSISSTPSHLHRSHTFTLFAWIISQVGFRHSTEREKAPKFRKIDLNTKCYIDKLYKMFHWKCMHVLCALVQHCINRPLFDHFSLSLSRSFFLSEWACVRACVCFCANERNSLLFAFELVFRERSQKKGKISL